MSAFPESVKYDLPKKAMGSRVSKVQIAPRNGNLFKDGGQIQVQLPTMPNSYINLANAYLKFKIKAVGNHAHLDGTGYSLFSRISTSSQSAVINDLTSANVLYSALLDLGMGSSSLRDWGSVCLGSGGDAEQSHLGKLVSKDAKTGLCLPFFEGLFGSEKMLPLDTADGVVFTFYLETAVNSMISLAAGSVPTGYEIDDVSLHAYIYTLTPESQALLDQVSPMGYSTMFEGISHSSDSKATTELTKISTLGFRYSSLSKVLITHRASDNEGDANQMSITNRSHANMNEVGLMIGGLPVPERPITCDPAINDFSEPLSETLLSFGVLGDKFAQLGLNGATQDNTSADATSDTGFTNLHPRYHEENGHLPDGKDADDVKVKSFANMGSFVVAIDTDIVKAISSSPTGMYSGIDTLGATCQSRIRYSASSTNAQTIDYFGFYNSILTLNPITRSFEVSN